MQPPIAELTLLIRTLAFTAIVSLLLGYLLYRRGLARSPSLALTLVISYVWSGLLILVNVLVMSQQMFISPHDLALSIVLLLFSLVLVTTFGVFVAGMVTKNLRQLAKKAEAIAGGDLSARVQVSGRDEVAQVAEAFNEMAVKLQAAARQQEELEVLRRDLIAWTSHDLRTPLTSIRAMIEALNDDLVTDEATRKRYYRTMRTDIVALNDLIDDLFELAQLNAGGLDLEKSAHSLSDLISDTIESFTLLAENYGIRLEGNVDEGVDPVWMNAPKIGRVLTNLISNALHYTPTGGTVVVSVLKRGQAVEVTVKDNGPGFTEVDIHRVFEKFYRGEQARSRKTGGAGLGLAIAHAIVEAHDGMMWAENAPTEGAIVGFRIPVKK